MIYHTVETRKQLGLPPAAQATLEYRELDPRAVAASSP